jgi:hypothetical protein
MTTIAPPTTTVDSVVRRARIGAAGAVLWTLSSGVWAASDLEDQPYGTLSFVAVAVAWWACMVAAPLLLLACHSALRTVLAPVTGRLGRAGLATSAAGLAGMGLGIGIEVASMSAGGGEVAAGHAVLLASFVVALLGGLVTGITVIRRLADPAARVAGWVLALALPLGVGVGLLGSVLAPGSDAVFWAVLTLPTGLAWVLLGFSLARERRTSATR